MFELHNRNKGTPRRALKYDAHNLLLNLISQKISNCAASTVPYDVKSHENHIKIIQSRIKIIYVIRTSLGAFSARSHVRKYPVKNKVLWHYCEQPCCFNLYFPPAITGRFLHSLTEESSSYTTKNLCFKLEITMHYKLQTMH